MNRIGVVGPIQSIERILEVANEFEHELTFITFPYDDVGEVKEIVTNHQAEVDGWFFSGPIPYTLAKNILDKNADIGYCPLIGASLYKSIIQLFFEQKKFANKISIDMIQPEERDLLESLQELDIPSENMFVKTFDEDYDSNAITQFHLQLWKEGKINGVITGLNSVYQALKKEKIPVYRIRVTKMEIRQAMKIVVGKVKSSYFKESQIGVEIIEISHFDQMVDKTEARYHLQQMELRIKQNLLHLCEKLDGSLLENGNGRYQIFSSRGAIEREIDMLYNTVQQLILETDLPVRVGIGFGETAFSAEINARKAIQHSKEKEKDHIIAVHEDGVIVESIGKKEELTYSYRSDDKELIDKLKNANISIKTYKKIEALTSSMGWEGFTTVELAARLNMTVRNVQRIMNGLNENGLAEYIGEEILGSRGRPRKVYKLK
ncbi:hypothetical protein ACQKCU_09115 [Heyndrickxia sporothermodurans]